MTKILLAIKYTPDPYQVKIHARTGTLLIEDVEFGINPKDLYAIELAMRLKESLNAEVIAITVGPRQAEEAVREALGFGVDKGIVVYGDNLNFVDSSLVSKVLARYIQKEGGFDLVVMGAESSDMKSGVTSARLAAILGYPLAYNVMDVKVEGNKVIAKQDLFPKAVTVEMNTPAIISVSYRIGDPRYPNMWDISEAYSEGKVEFISAEELMGEGELKPLVNIRRYSGYSEEEGARRRISGSKEEIVKTITEMILNYL